MINEFELQKLNEGYEFCNKEKKDFNYTVEYLKAYSRTDIDTVLLFLDKKFIENNYKRK